MQGNECLFFPCTIEPIIVFHEIYTNKEISMFTYKAFGLYLSSDVEITQLQPIPIEKEIDVMVHTYNLESFHKCLPQNGHGLFRKDEFYFEMPEVGRFFIQNGNEILLQEEEGVKKDLLSAYLLGPCMGAILHQRGITPLHGSCVSDGNRSILILGESGAGKSTLAAEFISHGWKFITDDVAAIDMIHSRPIVQPSYPSQKLWQDSMDKYVTRDCIHSLYTRLDRTKFGVDVSPYYMERFCPLTIIIYLVPSNVPCKIQSIDGITKINYLMKNTYNPFMVMPEEKQNFFQRCVQLASKLPMALVMREKGKQCATELYNIIISYLEDK